jgi:agmatine deiminase
MLPNKDLDTLYFSSLLASDSRFTDTYEQLAAILQRHHIPFFLLDNTRDIWCRDYMPIQTSPERFVQFRYEPSYLRGLPQLQTNPDLVTQALGIETIPSSINLDGGNLVNWTSQAILTDRIFEENPEYERYQLIQELEATLEAEVLLIPSCLSDYTGHVDGMLRFVDAKTLIGNQRDQEYRYIQKGIQKILKSHGFDYIDLPFFEHKDKQYPDTALGCYANFLEIADLIILPVFEIPGNHDEEALSILQQAFPSRHIETLNMNAFGQFGGLGNCVSWGRIESLLRKL